MGLLYASIRARDIDKSVNFYKKMGMKVLKKWSPIPDEIVVQMESTDTRQRLNIMWYGKKCRLYKPYDKGDEMDHLMFEVKDAKKEFKRLVKNGAPIAMDLWEGKAGFTMGFVKDPDNIWVGVRSGNIGKRK